MKVVDALYEVKGKRIPVGGVVDVNIGANPSAEGEDEDAGVDEGSSATAVNVVDHYQLVETSFTKKDYRTHVKAYMAELVKKLQENGGDVAAFKAAASTSVKNILAQFEDCQFYMGRSMNPDGMHVIVIDKGDDITLFYFKDGLEEEKV